MRKWLPIVLAILLAVVAAGLVFFYTRGAEQRVLDEQQPVTVLVSTSSIPRGITLGDAAAGGLVEQTQVPSDMAPAGALGSVTPENATLLAINNVNPGQILLATNFAAELPDIVPVSIPDGSIAIAVSLGDVQRVGNFLRPGAEVVVFNSYTSGAEVDAEGVVITAGDLTTRVLVDRAQVLGVGETTSVATPNPDGTTTPQPPSALITLGVDQAEAEKIIQASQTGSLYFGLLGDGTEIVRSNGTTAGNLFD